MAFIIIEVEDGLTIVEVQSHVDMERAAEEHGGVLVDDGPFATYEEAIDCLAQLEGNNDEEYA